MPKLADILQLLVTWGVLAFALFLFGLIVHSTSTYRERRRFWRIQFLTIGVTYALSAFLSLVLHFNPIPVIMIALLAMFIIQGDIGLHPNDVSPLVGSENHSEHLITHEVDAHTNTPDSQ